MLMVAGPSSNKRLIQMMPLLRPPAGDRPLHARGQAPLEQRRGAHPLHGERDEAGRAHLPGPTGRGLHGGAPPGLRARVSGRVGARRLRGRFLRSARVG